MVSPRKTRAKSPSRVGNFATSHNHVGHGHPYRGVSLSVRKWRENYAGTSGQIRLSKPNCLGIQSCQRRSTARPLDPPPFVLHHPMVDQRLSLSNEP